MSTTTPDTLLLVADVLEKTADYIHAIEVENHRLKTADETEKKAAEEQEISTLASALAGVRGETLTEELQSKIATTTPETRGLLRDLMDRTVNPDLGTVSEKTSAHTEDAGDRLVNWCMS